ncbi:MAG: TolC family protein [Phycisphaerales bacterium]
MTLGCETPFAAEGDREVMHQSLIDAVRREINELPSDAGPRRLTQPTAEVEEAVAGRRDELEQLAGPASYGDGRIDLSPELSGAAARSVDVGLREAILTAVSNNLVLQQAELEPAIAEADVIRAEAAFDAVFFSSITHSVLDEPSTVPILRGVPLGTAASVRDVTRFETGIRKPLTTGGRVELSTSIDRTDVSTPGFAVSPNPGYLTRIALGIEQPLLRGFGRSVNRAGILHARNQDRRSIQNLRTSLLNVIEQTEVAYWNLIVARQSLLIQRRLLERGIETRDRLELRSIRDASTAQLTEAVATVENRRANLIRAERAVRAASDQLKVLLNDPAFPVTSEVDIVPVDQMVEAALEYDIREAILTALEHRPEIHSALLDIDDAAITTRVADNARLPLLNASVRMEFIGLDNDIDGSYDQGIESTFIDYVLGLAFEAPIGNRAAQAGFRQARLQQSAAGLRYRAAVQNVVFDVKSALRDVAANYELIQATRSTRLAQTESLRALLAEQENRIGLTPESLNLRFQRQEALAQAEIAEVSALANFNIAVARLMRAMGLGLQHNNIATE